MTEQWECVRCGGVGPRPKTDSTSPTYRLGQCRNCRSFQAWRIHNPQVTQVIGLQRQRVGQTLAYGAERMEWKVRARQRALSLASTGESFTSEDITEAVGLPEHRNAVGALLGGLARSGRIRRVGDTIGTRASQQGRRISVWEGI